MGGLFLVKMRCILIVMNRQIDCLDLTFPTYNTLCLTDPFPNLPSPPLSQQSPDGNFPLRVEAGCSYPQRDTPVAHPLILKILLLLSILLEYPSIRRVLPRDTPLSQYTSYPENPAHPENPACIVDANYVKIITL